MFNLIDIAYVIPATVFVGYWVGKFLEAQFGGSYKAYSIIIFALLGFVLTFMKIMKFVQNSNQKNKSSSQPQPNDESNQ